VVKPGRPNCLHHQPNHPHSWSGQFAWCPSLITEPLGCGEGLNKDWIKEGLRL